MCKSTRKPYEQRSTFIYMYDSINRTTRIGGCLLSFQKKGMAFEGEVEYYWDEANDLEWFKVGGRGLVDMLRKMGYQHNTIGKHAKVKVTIEILEPGDEFLKGFRQKESGIS